MVRARLVSAKTMIFKLIYVNECSTCRYVRLNALNVLHVPRPCFIAPKCLNQFSPLNKVLSYCSIMMHFIDNVPYAPLFRSRNSIRSEKNSFI